jgi:hypothetical protein
MPLVCSKQAKQKNQAEIAIQTVQIVAVQMVLETQPNLSASGKKNRRVPRRKKNSDLGHPFCDLTDTPVPRQGYNINLHAITSTEDSRFLNVVLPCKLSYGSRPFSLRDSKLLPHLHWCGVYTEAQHHYAALGTGITWWGGAQQQHIITL